MFRNGRSADAAFLPADKLFHRCTKVDVEGDRLLPAKIRCDNVSVNWSKYSKPWDVIFDHPGCGIARFVVRYLPVELPKELPPPPRDPKKRQATVNIFSFRPVHDPEEENFAHCEIATFKDAQRVEKPNLSATVKKEFRQIMSDRSLVLYQPEV